MRKTSLVIALIGIFILLIMLNFSHPIQVNSQKDLSSLIENSKVQTKGKVIGEKQIGNEKILNLDNHLEIICRTCPSYLGQIIYIEGIIEKYQNKTQIQALKIIQNNR